MSSLFWNLLDDKPSTFGQNKSKPPKWQRQTASSVMFWCFALIVFPRVVKLSHVVATRPWPDFLILHFSGRVVANIYIYIWLIDYLLTVRMSHWSLDTTPSYLDFCPEDAGIPHARSLPSFDACTAAGISRDGFSGRKRARRDWMLNEFLLVILWCVFWGLFLFVSWCIVYCLLSCFGWVRSVRKIVDSRYPRSALLPSVHYSIFSPPQYIQ